MKPTYLVGRGLACSLGLSVGQSLHNMQQGVAAVKQVVLPGSMHASFPFHAIPYLQGDWNERARHLVRSVVAEAGGQHSRDGALFIATSSFDIGAVEQGAVRNDYRVFSDKVAGWLDWSGPVYTVSTACTSSMNALLSAQALIRSGAVDEALVLGMELDNCLTLGGFAALQLLSGTACRPFGKGRDGLVLGEAVAALRLSARERSEWKLLGGANVVDGSQPTGASVSATVSMYQGALSASGIPAKEVDLIKVQAAGSPGNDAVEAQALCETFGIVPPLVSLKAAMGHAMGASGAAEIALLTACLEQNVWPRCAGDAEPELGVRLAEAMPHDVRHVMATILGFGGSHASVILERA